MSHGRVWVSGLGVVWGWGTSSLGSRVWGLGLGMHYF